MSWFPSDLGLKQGVRTVSHHFKAVGLLGLGQTVAQDVLKAVGNYGEIYDRNLGPGGMNLPREGGRNGPTPPARTAPRAGRSTPLR